MIFSTVPLPGIPQRKMRGMIWWMRCFLSATRYIQAYAFVGCNQLSIVSGLENVEILEDACFSTGSSLRVKFGDKITKASYSFYTGHGEIYIKRGSLLADQDRFGQYENDTSIVFQVIIY